MIQARAMDTKKENSPPANGDDSISDFKSPETKKIKASMLPKLLRGSSKSKRKVELNPNKLHINNHRERRKKEESRSKKSTDKSERTIESSFFKMKEESALDNVKAGIVCPLCFKVFKDQESQALHMKICAIKHKISTKQLMDVVELQKRQEEERKSLGLRTGPALQEKKKSTPRRSQAQTEEADLQLGLALSKSLHEMEGMSEYEDLYSEAEFLHLDEKEPKILPQLEKFGFASTSKAVPKTRKRKLNGLTVLQTRTEADRNRILTERIAEIVMECDAVTQAYPMSPVDVTDGEALLRSSLLKTLHCSESYLWRLTSSLSEQAEFYVNELSDYIIPCEKKVPVDSGDKIHETAAGSPKKWEECIEKTETFGDQKRFYEMSIASPRFSEGNVDQKFVDQLSAAWGRALNDSSASDLIINVKSSKRIFAHKLVFFVRCPNILLDVIPNDDPTIKEKIDWSDTPFELALTFLEFVYCGRIQKIEDNSGVSGLRNMARKYRVQELFEYLHRTDQRRSSPEVLSPEEKARVSPEPNVEVTQTTSERQVQETVALDHVSMSPDMFEETFEMSTAGCNNEEPVEVALTPNTPISVNSTRARSCKAGNSPPSSSRRGSSLKRSNLSLFIEKFRRENNKSDSDSDSTTILDIPRRPVRNPFNVGRDSLSMSSNKHCADTSPVKKNGLDALEFSDADTEPINSPSVTSDEEDLTQLEQDLNLCTQRFSVKCETSKISLRNSVNESLEFTQYDTDENDMSMYTKYKKTHRHNSISDYRSLIEKRIAPHDSPKGNATNNSVSKNRTVINEVEIAMLSDSETKSFIEDEPSRRLRRKRKSRKPTELSQKKFEESGSDTDILSAVSPDRTVKSSPEQFCTDKRSPEQFRTNKNSPEQFQANKNSPEQFCTDKNSPEQFQANKNSPEQFCTDKNSPEQFRTGSYRFEPENISSCRLSALCTWEGSKTEMNDERNGLLSPMRIQEPSESPVWVLSSPEVSVEEPNTKRTNDKAWNRSDDDMDHIFEHEIYLANVRVDDDVISEPPSPMSKSKSDGLMRYSFDNVRNPRESVTLDNAKSKTDLSVSASRRTDELGSQRLSVRKLQRKSVSHGSLNRKQSNTTSCHKCYRENLHRDSLKASRFVRSTTPPPDYQSMDTPKLHNELKRYGLKLQKRKRAVKLLTHIYNELHPVIPAGQNISGESDESPAKRLSQESSNGLIEEDTCQDYSIADVPASDNVIAEERRFDEAEPASGETSTNIKERFLKLLKTDRGLYNKILSYEPLCFETLHAALKADGLKCSKNSLMDFLDEQCITFYMQENNRRDGRKRRK